MQQIYRHLNRHFINYSFFLIIGLIIASWIYILQDQPNAVSNLFSADNRHYLVEFISGMLGIGENLPAYLDPQMWTFALILSLETFIMSILAIGIATIAMLIFILPAAHNMLQGNFHHTTRWYHRITYYISHFFFLISRAIPELMWAMILIFIFKPGIFLAALALAIHNFGVLGKLCTEVIENMDEKPIRRLIESGASQTQLLFYGIYPSVIHPFLNYILYRMENIIRATLIVGFVGAGGLGMQFKLAMSFFRYSEIMLYLLCYLLLVYITDILSAWAKHYIRTEH